jgi:hypothetical protein
MCHGAREGEKAAWNGTLAWIDPEERILLTFGGSLAWKCSALPAIEESDTLA